MNLRSILNHLHEIRYFKRVIKKYGNSLQPGRYKLYPSLRAIALNDRKVLDYSDRYFDTKSTASKTTALISKINQTSYYKNNTKSQAEKYDAVYSANNHDKIREIKLFAFNRSEILTVCTGPEAYNKQFAEYAAFNKYFSMPKINACSTYKYAYKISMISPVARASESDALSCIAKCTSAYRKEHLSESQTTNAAKIISAGNIISLPQCLTEKLSSAAMEIDIPMCLQHGDLSRSNLIYGICDGKTDFWWIDWEHSAERIFFYDYFFYILNTAFYYSDTEALDAYLSGACDDSLTEFFADFGLKFEPQLRKDYFMISALDFLRERVCDKNNPIALEMYCDFIIKTIFNKE